MNKLQLQITNSPWEWGLRKGSGSWGNRVKLLMCHWILPSTERQEAPECWSRNLKDKPFWTELSHFQYELCHIPTAQTQNPCTAACEGSAGESQTGGRWHQCSQTGHSHMGTCPRADPPLPSPAFSLGTRNNILRGGRKLFNYLTLRRVQGTAGWFNWCIL